MENDNRIGNHREIADKLEKQLILWYNIRIYKKICKMNLLRHFLNYIRL